MVELVLILLNMLRCKWGRAVDNLGNRPQLGIRWTRMIIAMQMNSSLAQWNVRRRPRVCLYLFPFTQESRKCHSRKQIIFSYEFAWLPKWLVAAYTRRQSFNWIPTVFFRVLAYELRAVCISNFTNFMWDKVCTLRKFFPCAFFNSRTEKRAYFFPDWMCRRQSLAANSIIIFHANKLSHVPGIHIYRCASDSKGARKRNEKEKKNSKSRNRSAKIAIFIHSENILNIFMARRCELGGWVHTHTQLMSFTMVDYGNNFIKCCCSFFFSLSLCSCALVPSS